MRISLAALYTVVLATCTPAMAQGIWIWEPYKPNPEKAWPAPPLNLPAWAVWLDGQLIAEPNYQLEP